MRWLLWTAEAGGRLTTVMARVARGHTRPPLAEEVERVADVVVAGVLLGGLLHAAGSGDDE